MIRVWTFITLVLGTVTAMSAEPAKLALKTEKLDLPKEVAEELRAEFGTEAFALTDGDGKAMTFWFRKEIPVKATVDQVKNGLTYREVPEGTLIGVVKLDKAFLDFRKQEIAAGVYTLRIAVQPDTGDHKETAPHADFCLLTPAGDDKTLDPLELKDLVKRSLKATGGDHPAVMLLVPHYGKEAGASVVAKQNSIQCLQLKMPVKAEEATASLGFSIVVAGVSKTR